MHKNQNNIKVDLPLVLGGAAGEDAGVDGDDTSVGDLTLVAITLVLGEVLVGEVVEDGGGLVVDAVLLELEVARGQGLAGGHHAGHLKAAGASAAGSLAQREHHLAIAGYAATVKVPVCRLAYCSACARG